jgi:hypothetical protein
MVETAVQGLHREHERSIRDRGPAQIAPLRLQPDALSLLVDRPVPDQGQARLFVPRSGPDQEVAQQSPSRLLLLPCAAPRGLPEDQLPERPPSEPGHASLALGTQNQQGGIARISLLQT